MLSLSTRSVAQAGILSGKNPAVYDPSNPILVFIIQAGIIIIFCRLLHWPLSKIRQPRVISEIIGGILLGPSVFGHIPNFTQTIFPTASMPTLNTVANLGLVFFLFLVGLETDLRYLVSNWRIAASVSVAGMVLPFGLGCAISYGLYHQFRSDPGIVDVDFGTYLLFIGIAMAITAFPVLCRILIELKLLNTNIGVIVLSAGVGNDVTGWVLLALCIALVNAGSGITALWVLLVAIGYILFLFVALRPVFIWYLRRTGNLEERGPSQSAVTVTLLLVMASAFFTQAIGIHAIFGGFVMGLVCPHERGFAIKLTEKVEDLVTGIFLPLYFALSGLQTNLGLLNTAIAWGYVVAIIAIAFFAKVAGGTLAARFTGLLWRESFTVGVLMSCKGLVELIVLNIGLNAHILSQRTFTMFIVMALVTTFMTTPLTLLLYPQWYQDKVLRWRRGEIDWSGNVIDQAPSRSYDGAEKPSLRPIEKITVYLRLDSVANVCTFIGLLGTDGKSSESAPREHYSKRAEPKIEDHRNVEETGKQPLLHAHGIRLMELTDRLSSTMQVSEIEDYSLWDPVVNVFRSFGQINNIPSEGRVTVIPETSFADAVLDLARDTNSNLLLLPWSASGGMADRQSIWPSDNPSTTTDFPYSLFVSDILRRVTSSIQSGTHIGILVDRALDMPSQERHALERNTNTRSLPDIRTNLASLTARNRNQHIMLLYVGSADDRFALRLVLQLAQNQLVTATIVQVDVPYSAKSSNSAETSEEDPQRSTNSNSSVKEKEINDSFFASMRDSLSNELSSRVVFRTVSSVDPSSGAVKLAVDAAHDEASQAHGEANLLIIVGRRNTLGDASSNELGDRSDTRSVLGVVGDALVHGGPKASVLIVQAAVSTY